MAFDGPVQHMEVQLACPPLASAIAMRSAVSAAQAPSVPAASLSLADLPPGVVAVVAEILPPLHDDERDLVLRLIEIGFVPGEPVRVVAQGFPGREPIAVRLGGTTFALRRFEAEYIRVAAPGATGLG